MENKIKAFCANCQTELGHLVDFDGNGELTLVCRECQRVIKLGRDVVEKGADGVLEFLASHKAENIGQVSIEKTKQAVSDIVTKINEAQSQVETVTSNDPSQEAPATGNVPV